jgi:hypothetical protein
MVVEVVLISEEYMECRVGTIPWDEERTLLGYRSKLNKRGCFCTLSHKLFRGKNIQKKKKKKSKRQEKETTTRTKTQLKKGNATCYNALSLLLLYKDKIFLIFLFMSEMCSTAIYFLLLLL